MTKRAYWDSRGQLWEDNDHPLLLTLLWSPYSEIGVYGGYELSDSRELVAELHGPLVGVA